MKQVLVIGGGRGLGAALVHELLDQNYSVTVAGRTKPRDPRVRCFVAADATAVDWRSLYPTIESATSHRIDAMVFNAGAGVFGRTGAIPAARARQVFELNFWACAQAAQEAAEYWQHHRMRGTFLAVLSIVARRAVPFEAHYAASKAAAARFLECLQLEHASAGLRFLPVFPGMLNTDFRRRADWYGLPSPSADVGASVAETAHSVVRLLQGRRKRRVIGWRESVIDVADRLAPGLYDRAVLHGRVQQALKKAA